MEPPAAAVKCAALAENGTDAAVNCFSFFSLLLMALLLLEIVPLFAKIGQLLLLKAPIYPDENDTGAAVNSVTVIDTAVKAVSLPPIPPSSPSQLQL
jgi:hypothetical protein